MVTEYKGNHIANIDKNQRITIDYIAPFIQAVECYKKRYSIEQGNQIAKLFNCSPRDFLPKKYIEDKNYLIIRRKKLKALRKKWDVLLPYWITRNIY